ncbi:hypothetical protein [Reyranella sp.]|uniref:hypothetical protein n=1 Tax=Reyranella sp. TaxID=1929291 RepID=UPI003D0E7770
MAQSGELTPFLADHVTEEGRTAFLKAIRTGATTADIPAVSNAKGYRTDGAGVASAPTSSSHRSTATTVFSSVVGAIAAAESNPLVEGDRLQAFRLAFRAYSALAQNRDDAASRADLCIAAFLQNRAEDDGSRMGASSSFGGDYAVSTALHVQFPHVGQGESISTIHATKIRLSQDDEAAAQVVADALGLSRSNRPIRLVIADELERLYRCVGMPIRLSELNIPRSALPLIAGQTVKNFNANAGVRSDGERIAAAQQLLEAAY